MYLVSFPGGLNIGKFREMSFAVLAFGEFMCSLGGSCSRLLAMPMLLPSPPPGAAAVAATAIAATAAATLAPDANILQRLVCPSTWTEDRQPFQDLQFQIGNTKSSSQRNS